MEASLRTMVRQVQAERHLEVDDMQLTLLEADIQLLLLQLGLAESSYTTGRTHTHAHPVPSPPPPHRAAHCACGRHIRHIALRVAHAVVCPPSAPRLPLRRIALLVTIKGDPEG